MTRLQDERADRRPGEERGGAAMDPVVVPFAIEGRERVARLAAGHVEDALLLAARRDDQALGGPEVGPLDPGHVGPSAGQGVGPWYWGISPSALRTMLKLSGFDVVEEFRTPFHVTVVAR